MRTSFIVLQLLLLSVSVGAQHMRFFGRWYIEATGEMMTSTDSAEIVRHIGWRIYDPNIRDFYATRYITSRGDTVLYTDSVTIAKRTNYPSLLCTSLEDSSARPAMLKFIRDSMAGKVLPIENLRYVDIDGRKYAAFEVQYYPLKGAHCCFAYWVDIEQAIPNGEIIIIRHKRKP